MNFQYFGLYLLLSKLHLGLGFTMAQAAVTGMSCHIQGVKDYRETDK